MKFASFGDLFHDAYVTKIAKRGKLQDLPKKTKRRGENLCRSASPVVSEDATTSSRTLWDQTTTNHLRS